MRFASDPELAITRLPSGLLAIDVLLKGGFARGRYTEIFGGYNVGKTAITFDTIATNQQDGAVCSFVDVEGTFDPEFAYVHGVDLESLALTRQSDLEHGHNVIDYIEAQLRSGIYDIIVLDSIASLLPKSEWADSIGDASMGTDQARLMSKALRKLTAANRKTVLIFINQTRQAVSASAFAKQTVTSGGLAMGFYSGTRLEVVRIETVKKDGKGIDPKSGNDKKQKKAVGHRLLVRVEKDKTGAAVQTDETTMVYDYRMGGFDRVEDLLYLGRVHGLIKKNGSRWSLKEYPDDTYNSRGAFKNFLRADELVAEELEGQILQAVYAERDDDLTDDEDDDDE